MTEKIKPKVLYIDDEEDNLVVFKSAFRRHYDVTVAKSGSEALDLLKSLDVEMIITDQRMPGMTGIELLKSLPEQPEVIRIILTGYSDIEAVIEAINLGKVYRYITKPWDKLELKLTIDKALETLGLKIYNKELVKRLEEYNQSLEIKVKERTKEISEQHIEIQNQKQLLEKEKEKADALLLNILPLNVAEELKENGTSEARRYEDVTVLFSDFKNFTRFSDAITPTEVVTQLDHCFRAFDDITVKYGLEKIKTIGDAYMCTGGLTKKDPDSALNVVRAAIEMQKFLEQIKGSKHDQLSELRIGIHTGPVVAGVVGKIKFAYDIWGDTVNIASRMESSSEVGKINISEETLLLLKDEYKSTFRGEIDVKGKGNMKMYFVNF
jgi:class 3 adenylate cyclase/CheY-like chemotaxis protein